MCTESIRGLLDAVRPDPPEHDPIRRIFMRILAPALVRRWRQQILASADELVERLVARRRLRRGYSSWPTTSCSMSAATSWACPMRGVST